MKRKRKIALPVIVVVAAIISAFIGGRVIWNRAYSNGIQDEKQNKTSREYTMTIFMGRG